MSRTVRRKFKARRALTATAAIGAVAAATAVSVQFAAADETGPAAAQSCVLDPLPIPDGFQSTVVTGMSVDGSVVAYYAEPLDLNDPDGFVTQPLVYADGEVTEVPIPGVYQQLADVNSAGDGAGYGEIDGNHTPFAWRDGELVELSDRGFAHGINEDGDIVGELWAPPGSDTGDVTPVLWPADGSDVVELPLPDDAKWGVATAIGDDGTAVGHITLDGDNSGMTKPYVWHPDGTGEELPMPEGVDRLDVYSEAMDIKGEWVSGLIDAPETEAPGARWNLADGTVEMTELGQSRETVAIGADGTAAGTWHGQTVAAFQTGATVVALPGVLDPSENINWDNAEAISADGTVLAGTAYAGPDQAGQNLWAAVVWTCA